MRHRARSVPTRSLSSSLCLAIPAMLALSLSGCAGVGNYLETTVNPFGNPNAPKGNAINMQRARGTDVAVAPILPQPGDVWPGKLRPVPTLGEIQQHMNVPLGQAYQNDYGANAGVTNGTGTVPGAASGTASGTYAMPPGGTVRRMPSGTMTHSTLFKSPATATETSPSAPVAGGFAVGQTLNGPSGPVGVVSGKSNGRYQTVAPVAGRGGGILIPNGNGSATLIQPDGQVITVQGQ